MESGTYRQMKSSAACTAALGGIQGGLHHMPPTSCSSATDLFSQRSQISFIVTGKAWYDTVALWRPCTFQNVYYGP